MPGAAGYVRSVAVLSREEFDAIEFDAACTGDHLTAARQMSELAVTAAQTDAMPRSEAFLRAGEQWLLADDPAAAANVFRLAMADGGPVFVDPRVSLARALFQLDKDAEAQSLLAELKAEGRPDPRVCDLVAELLVERSDLAGALDWATAGVEQGLQRGDVAELRLLLSLRYRIRNDLGLPEDSYDELLDA